MSAVEKDHVCKLHVQKPTQQTAGLSDVADLCFSSVVQPSHLLEAGPRPQGTDLFCSSVWVVFLATSRLPPQPVEVMGYSQAFRCVSKGSDEYRCLSLYLPHCLHLKVNNSVKLAWWNTNAAAWPHCQPKLGRSLKVQLVGLADGQMLLLATRRTRLEYTMRKTSLAQR